MSMSNRERSMRCASSAVSGSSSMISKRGFSSSGRRSARSSRTATMRSSRFLRGSEKKRLISNARAVGGGGVDDGRGRGAGEVAGTHHACEAPPVQLRHVDVSDDELNGLFAEFMHGLGAVACLDEIGIACLPQRPRQQLARIVVI